MRKPSTYKPPWQTLVWIIAAMAVLLIFIEGWRYMTKPNLDQKDQIISKNLQEAASLFQAKQQNLLERTEQLAEQLHAQISQEDSSKALYETIQNYSDLWGVALMSNNNPIVWNGFSLGPLQTMERHNDRATDISIERKNNVLFWVARAGFSVTNDQTTTPYRLFATQRIIQKNALPIGDKSEFNIFDEDLRRYNYPLEVSIYEPMPEQDIAYRVLENISQDSVGIVYAVTGHFQEVLLEWEKSNNFWRSVFALLCFMITGLFIIFWIDLRSVWKNLLVQLIIIGIGWAIFNYISISTQWLPLFLESMPANELASYQLLFEFFIDGIFLFFGAYAAGHAFKNASPYFGNIPLALSIIAGFIVGVVNMFVIVTVIRKSYDLILTTSFSLLNLQIIPPFGTLLLYACMGLMLWAVSLLILTLIRLLLHICRYQYKWCIVASIIGFLLGLVIVQFVVNQSIDGNWQFWLSIIFYGLIFSLTLIHFKYRLLISYSSNLRNAAVAGFILSVAGTTIIYHAQMAKQDKMLVQTAQTYSIQEDEKARNLLQNLLTGLHDQFRTVEDNDLQDFSSFIQPLFTQTVQSKLASKSSSYKVHLSLINSNGIAAASYSNALITPEWVDFFNHSRLYATTLLQGISENFIRPVIQQPTLINQHAYETFYRGWIPIYDSNNSIVIAWIVGSVYQKRPDFDKPIQTLIASLNFDNRNQPVSIQEYRNRQLSLNIYNGTNAYFPIYNTLPADKSIFESDTVAFYNSQNEQASYRILLKKESENEVLKISTHSAGIQNILFSFFRLCLTLLLAGFIAALFFQFIKTGKITLINKNDLFQYRILDSFLLATLVFLLLIIAGSYFALNEQNENLVQQDLLDKLEAINKNDESINLFNNGNRPANLASVIDSLTAQIDTDASFYSDFQIIRSTTPQIYEQHLLPAFLPFPVYYQLFEKQKRNSLQAVKLANQPLFIGYKSLVPNDNESQTALAIPTFVQSPKYRGQLQETTSYLVMLYLLIFSLFIVAVIIISQQLTKPLHEIREGLRNISRGNLETKIPVNRRDEIGMLASSYNMMAVRLKKLKSELAISERKAGWKEVAQQAAHDIKNPLTPMKLNIQHLKQQIASNKNNTEELRNKIQHITDNLMFQIESMNTIAVNFLKFSSSSDASFQEVDINNLIKRIESLYQHHQKKILQTKLTKKATVIQGIEDELYRAIFNLTKNAYEATPENGGVIKIRTYRKSNDVYIDVEDQGEGIADKDKAEIFTPNFSTKTSGTGLGLAICKKIISAHNGRISFASNAEEGTTFTIKLPCKKLQE